MADNTAKQILDEKAQTQKEREADPAFQRGEVVLGREGQADVYDPTVAGRGRVLDIPPVGDAITGRTPEQGPLQPGPELDVRHAAGDIDDEGYADRKRAISHPADIAEEQAAEQAKAAAKQPRDTGNVQPAATAEEAGDGREVEVGPGSRVQPGAGKTPAPRSDRK